MAIKLIDKTFLSRSGLADHHHNVNNLDYPSKQLGLTDSFHTPDSVPKHLGHSISPLSNPIALLQYDAD
jgi:hypothetical protein